MKEEVKIANTSIETFTINGKGRVIKINVFSTLQSYYDYFQLTGGYRRNGVIIVFGSFYEK